MVIRSAPLTAAICLGLTGMLSACGPSSEEQASAVAADEDVAETPLLQATCDLTGTWATKTVVPVSWLATLGIQAGSGAVTQYTKSTRVQTGTSFTDTLQICGITSPDYQSRPIFGGELYGVRFPASLFDANDLPTSTATGTLSAAEVGATYTINDVLVLLGLTMEHPLTDPWPAQPSDVNAVPGANGKPGITVLAATDPGYWLPPVNATRTRRATSFQLAIRNVGSSSGTVVTCDRITGTATVVVIHGKPALDTHVLGCTRTDGAACDADEVGFVDSQSPVFAPTGSGTVVSLRVAPDATCADVRAAAY